MASAGARDTARCHHMAVLRRRRMTPARSPRLSVLKLRAMPLRVGLHDSQCLPLATRESRRSIRAVYEAVAADLMASVTAATVGLSSFQHCRNSGTSRW